MLNYTKTQNLNGSSVIKTDKAELIAATMSGTVNNDGSVSYNFFISDAKLYKENEKEVQADANEFQQILYSLADSTN